MGMIPGLFDDDKRTREWDKYVREIHHIRSFDYVHNKAEKWGLNVFERVALANICKYHRKKMDLDEIEEVGDIRVKLLTAYLRLADAIHIDKVGYHELEKYQTYLMLGMDIESKFHWLKAKYATGASTDPESFKIGISVRQPENWGKKEIEPFCNVFIEEINDEIEPIKEILVRGRSALYLDVDASTVSDKKVNSNELKELIHKIDLWSSPNAGMAIGSVLNAINFINKIEDLKMYTKYLTEFLSERPCHVYLHKIQEMLDKHLKDKISEKEKIKRIKHDAQLLIKEREFAKEELPKNARPFLIDGSPILLYANSDSVLLALDDLPDYVKANMKVYVCECNTKTQHRFNNRLLYKDGIRYSDKVKNSGYLRYLFCWDDDALEDSTNNLSEFPELLEFLWRDLDISWTKNAEIRKSDDAKTISIFKDGNSAEITLSEEEKKAKLEIRDGQIHDLTVKKENEKLNIYKDNVIIVPDSSVSFLFKNGKVKKVFFGANGIQRETGEMGHSLGHLTVADAANKYNIPVYVIAEFMKIGEFEPNAELQREGDWLTTDRAYTSNDFKTFNPREDIVPADRIKFLITELGAIPAERLPSDYEMLEKKRQLKLKIIEQ